jgi:hypothetical protein
MHTFHKFLREKPWPHGRPGGATPPERPDRNDCNVTTAMGRTDGAPERGATHGARNELLHCNHSSHARASVGAAANADPSDETVTAVSLPLTIN